MDGTHENMALFPLKLFLLPGEYVELHVFEDRYKRLIEDNARNSLPFGIVFTDKNSMPNLGCTVEVVEVQRLHPNGELDITVVATSLFYLRSFQLQKDGKPYPSGHVDFSLEMPNEPASEELDSAFRQFLHKDPTGNADMLLQTDIGLLDVANELMMSDREKSEFVLCGAPNERDTYLINYLRFIKLLEAQEGSVYNNIYLN